MDITPALDSFDLYPVLKKKIVLKKRIRKKQKNKTI